jgi:hypothetical protein
VETKRCNKCGETKPVTEFGSFREKKGSEPGEYRIRPRTYCKACMAIACNGHRERIHAAEIEIAAKRISSLAPERRCHTCNTVKALDEFPRLNYVTSTGKQSWRYTSPCKECSRLKDRDRYSKDPERHRGRAKAHREANPAVVAGTMKRWRERNPEKLRLMEQLRYQRSMERLYGVTFEQYCAYIEEHGRLCAICGSEEQLGIDHCHSTRRFRGLLCSGCNLALGNIKENLERALGLAKYIRERCSDS